MEINELRRLSAHNELSLNYIAKDLMISKALLALQDFPNIVFKGGTAINRVYLKQKGRMRFSEDIDLDYDSKKQVKDAVNEINKLVSERFDFFIVDKPRIMKDIIRFDLNYINPLEHKDKIRLEFRVKQITEKYSKQIVNYGFVPHDSALLNVYEKDILIQHKIDCVLTRKEGKDIYDLYYLLDEYFSIDKTTASTLIKSLMMDETEIRNLSNALNHFIPKQQRPVLSELIDELVVRLKNKS